MSTWANIHEWYFNDTDAKLAEEVVSKGLWEACEDEIRISTNITSVHSDVIATTRAMSEDDWNDDVNIAIKIISKYAEK